MTFKPTGRPSITDWNTYTFHLAVTVACLIDTSIRSRRTVTDDFLFRLQVTLAAIHEHRVGEENQNTVTASWTVGKQN